MNIFRIVLVGVLAICLTSYVAGTTEAGTTGGGPTKASAEVTIYNVGNENNQIQINATNTWQTVPDLTVTFSVKTETAVNAKYDLNGYTYGIYNQKHLATRTRFVVDGEPTQEIRISSSNWAPHRLTDSITVLLPKGEHTITVQLLRTLHAYRFTEYETDSYRRLQVVVSERDPASP